MRNAFQAVGHVDMVFANAGISERKNYFTETLDENGNLEEPPSTLIDVNLTGVLYAIKLSWFAMKKQKTEGSMVITTSATANVPWQSLAVYSSVKLAVSETHPQLCQGHIKFSLTRFHAQACRHGEVSEVTSYPR